MSLVPYPLFEEVADASETYNLDIYGTLEPRMYRIVAETLVSEFLVRHGRITGFDRN